MAEASANGSDDANSCEETCRLGVAHTFDKGADYLDTDWYTDLSSARADDEEVTLHAEHAIRTASRVRRECCRT